METLASKWNVDLYYHLKKEKEIIIKRFNSTEILEAVDNAQDIYEKAKHLFREKMLIPTLILVDF